MKVDDFERHVRNVTKNMALYKSQCQKPKIGSDHFWIPIRVELICVREISRNYKDLVDSHWRMQIIPPYKNQEGFPFLVAINTQKIRNPSWEAFEIYTNTIPTYEVHLGCQYVAKMNYWGLHRLYVSITHTVFCKRESRLRPCDSREETMRIYANNDRVPLLFCAKAAIVSIWWLPVLN